MGMWHSKMSVDMQSYHKKNVTEITDVNFKEIKDDAPVRPTEETKTTEETIKDVAEKDMAKEVATTPNSDASTEPTQVENMNLSIFEHLPAVALEIIFSYIPPEEIPYEEPWFFQSWSDIVHAPTYWKRRANLKISDDERTVLENHDNKKVYKKCMWRVCTLNYIMKLNEKNFPPSRWVMTDEHFKGKDEEFQKSQLERMMNTACAQILLREITIIEICTSSLFDVESVESFPLLIKLVAIRMLPEHSHPSHRATQQYTFLWTLDNDFSWWNFKPNFANLFDSEVVLFRPLDIGRFKGCLHSIDYLSQDQIRSLSLAIAVDENNVAIDPGLAKLNKFLKLQRFYLHLKAGTDVHTLGEFKADLRELCLHFSSVGPSHIEWVINSTKILQPRRRNNNPGVEYCYKSYNYLVFFDCFLSNKKMDKLLRGIASAGVMVNQVLATGPNLENDGSDKLSQLVYQLWPESTMLKFRHDPQESSERGYKRFVSRGDLVFYMKQHYTGQWSNVCQGGGISVDNFPQPGQRQDACLYC